MIFIPAWVTNVLFFVTFYLSGFQHVQLRRANPITNIQFVMCVFSLAMIIIVALYNRENPWLSLAFFIAAASSLGLMVRLHRLLPPLRKFQ